MGVTACNANSYPTEEFALHAVVCVGRVHRSAVMRLELDSDVLGHMSLKITCIASTHVFGIGSYKPAAAVDSLRQLAFPAPNPH